MEKREIFLLGWSIDVATMENIIDVPKKLKIKLYFYDLEIPPPVYIPEGKKSLSHGMSAVLHSLLYHVQRPRPGGNLSVPQWMTG